MDDNNFLLSVPLDIEIKDTIFSMDPHSALGPDGFTGLFYKQCWDFMGQDVCLVVHSFFTSGSIFHELNSNFIILIPKVQGANFIDKYRPIILGNFVFKIITKILADRVA